MCHITTISHSCSHPDINYWTVRCATGLQVDPNCRKDSPSYPCEKTSSVWETPFQCTRCSRPTKRPRLETIDVEGLYEEGMNLDDLEREECCDLALDDEEMERMDRELDELCSDEDDKNMDISGVVTPVPSPGGSYRKRKLTQSSMLCNESTDMARGRPSGPRKKIESNSEGENMRGRTKRRGLVAPAGGRAGGKRISKRSTRRV
ncbi:hypothetical protein EG327_001125 [Venturia inaequalis]|uniref:Uncharacterized protein n=1 Tax=Venturia inaequalis TaxID=5025 RepID=A0A8H3Z909_VENIN|nr:hypothetical protein EG327_001125 [Venturia inaequalis]